jgi:hypothetical protein
VLGEGTASVKSDSLPREQALFHTSSGRRGLPGRFSVAEVCGTIDPLRGGARNFQDRGMPVPVVAILGATAFVILVCLTLWTIAEAYGRPGTDRPESGPKH